MKYLKIVLFLLSVSIASNFAGKTERYGNVTLRSQKIGTKLEISITEGDREYKAYFMGCNCPACVEGYIKARCVTSEHKNNPTIIKRYNNELISFLSNPKGRACRPKVLGNFEEKKKTRTHEIAIPEIPSIQFEQDELEKEPKIPPIITRDSSKRWENLEMDKSNAEEVSAFASQQYDFSDDRDLLNGNSPSINTTFHFDGFFRIPNEGSFTNYSGAVSRRELAEKCAPQSSEESLSDEETKSRNEANYPGLWDYLKSYVSLA